MINRFTDLWARGDATAIAELSSRDGVTLDFGGRMMGPLGLRQVAAMLRRLFDDRETLSVRMMTPQIVGGSPPRAFGEISWMMRSRGTTIPEKTSVFVALILQNDRWRITEIRFVQP